MCACGTLRDIDRYRGGTWFVVPFCRSCRERDHPIRAAQLFFSLSLSVLPFKKSHSDVFLPACAPLKVSLMARDNKLLFRRYTPQEPCLFW